MNYLRNLRKWIQENGSENVVYFDESGFEEHVHRPNAYALKGKKVFDEIIGRYQKRTNLIMAQRGKEWLAPVLFESSCTHHTVTGWIEQALLKELKPNSLIVMDNAPVHNKTEIAELLKQHGHSLLPLPTYSPDFSPIEQSFAVIKNRRNYSDKTLDQILSGHLLLE